jgi:hypothetical protein
LQPPNQDEEIPQMMQSTLTLDGTYATALGEDLPEYEPLEAADPGRDEDPADFDALLGSYGTWSPVVAAPGDADAEGSMDSAILAGLVSP